MTERIISKVLIAQEDLALGQGTTSQTRQGASATVSKLDLPWVLTTVIEVQRLDTSKYKHCILDNAGQVLLYRYDSASAETVDSYNYIAPNTGSGQWTLVRNLSDQVDFKTLDDFLSAETIESHISIVNIKSRLSWTPGSSVPKGTFQIHRTNGTASSPTVGTAVTITTKGKYGSASGAADSTTQSAQVGYFYDREENEWLIVAKDVVDVTWLGSRGDGSTDDQTALEDALILAKNLAAGSYIGVGGAGASPHNDIGITLHFPAGLYVHTGDLFFGTSANYDDQIKNITGHGATLVCKNTGGVAWDFSGAYGIRTYGLAFWGDSSNTPDVGLLVARNTAGDSAGKHRFIGCKIQGYFNVASYYNYGSEVNRWTNSEIRNIKSGAESSIYFTSSNGIQSVSSPNITIATGYQSSYSDFFSCCDIHFDVESNNATITSATNAPVIVESVDYGPRFALCYFDTLQGATDPTPICRIRRDVALSSSQERSEGIAFTGCTFENDYDSVIRVEANVPVQHIILDDECSFSESEPNSGDIVIESGADVRRYKVQRYKGLDKELVSIVNNGTLLENYGHSGLKNVNVGSTWDYNETGLTLDSQWRTLDIRVDTATPRAPERVHIKVRAKLSSSGTHDGSANAATLTDSGESWQTNQFIGGIIINQTDGSSGVITANTATTITATLSGGTDNDWDVGDTYKIILPTSAANKLQFRGSPSDADPADYLEFIAGDNDFAFAEGIITTQGNGSNTTGTHTGANNASVLADATLNLTTNELVGLIISNTTDGSTGLITANTANTITATLSGGSDNDWDTGDAYSVAFKEGSIQYKIPANISELDIKIKGYYL